MKRIARQSKAAAIHTGVAEGLTDRKIAAQLGIPQATVSHYRLYILRLPRTEQFLTHFRQKYGPDAVERLATMIQASASLGTIAGAFGFSKQNARLVKQKWGQLAGQTAPPTPAPDVSIAAQVADLQALIATVVQRLAALHDASRLVRQDAEAPCQRCTAGDSHDL